VKEEREMITKSMSGRRWFLKALEPNDLTILDKSRIQASHLFDCGARYLRQSFGIDEN
jgi:hypothetical protein